MQTVPLVSPGVAECPCTMFRDTCWDSVAIPWCWLPIWQIHRTYLRRIFLFLWLRVVFYNTIPCGFALRSFLNPAFSLMLITSLFQLAITTIKNNNVRKKMLAQFTGDIEAEFPAFSPAEWTRLLARLTLLVPSAGKEDIELFLSHISGCDSFRVL